MSETVLITSLKDCVEPNRIFHGDQIQIEYCKDESLSLNPTKPLAVVFPNSVEEIIKIVKHCNESGVPITVRGSGTGMSGGAAPRSDGIVVSLEQMNRVLEIDTSNFTATVEPGVTLAQLDTLLKEKNLIYPVQPGENSASLGGNVATNAGGMRAVKYGVTRNNVLGLSTVLASGEIIKTGGKYVKCSSGYDLTQLILGSEGTLGIVVEVTVKLQPRFKETSTILIPFRSLNEIMQAVPEIIGLGVEPSILEYLDFLAMEGAIRNVNLDLGIPKEIKEKALAYLLVMFEDAESSSLESRALKASELCDSLGALDIYHLPPGSAAILIDAREKAFWVAKASGADDIVDVVVPRAEMGNYLNAVNEMAKKYSALVAGCGHVGDGNVHLSLFQKDKNLLKALESEMFELALNLGGAISGEHGIGTEKRDFFLNLANPINIDIMRSIKKVFDPNGIFNPDHLI